MKPPHPLRDWTALDCVAIGLALVICLGVML